MVAASFFRQFKGFAIAPEDVQPSDVQSIDITISRGGIASSVSLSRKGATVTLRGLTKQQTDPFVEQAKQNRLRMARGSIPVEDLNFGSFVVEDAALVKATPSVPIVVAGQSIVETLVLEYQSQRYS